jgi:hypothetical protein
MTVDTDKNRNPKGYTPETVLLIEEVAEWLVVSVRTVERLPIKRIPVGERTRRYLAKHVLEYLESKAAA